MHSLLNTIGTEALVTLAYLLAPPILVALVVGFVVGVFQAATSINEMTLSFVPKFVAVAAVLTVLGPRMYDRIQRLFMFIFEHIRALAQ